MGKWDSDSLIAKYVNMFVVSWITDSSKGHLALLIDCVRKMYRTKATGCFCPEKLDHWIIGFFFECRRTSWERRERCLRRWSLLTFQKPWQLRIVMMRKDDETWERLGWRDRTLTFLIYTPEKLTWNPNYWWFCRYFSFSKEVFSGSMLDFGGAFGSGWQTCYTLTMNHLARKIAMFFLCVWKCVVFVKCVCVCGLHPPRSSDSFRVKARRNHPCFHLVKDEYIDNTMIICIVYNIYIYI